MTNPTPPLTAEEALKEIYNACDYGDSHGKSAAEWLEAYAAQQNAELVVENKLLKERLESAIDAIHGGHFITPSTYSTKEQELRHTTENQKSYITHLRTVIDEIKVENERLKKTA